jgi:C1A family cysteine protease
MNAVAKHGPDSVSVAYSPCHVYKGGVFYAPLQTLVEIDGNHLVVLEGYGTDEDSGIDFWLVRNSWGPQWGRPGISVFAEAVRSGCRILRTIVEWT